MNDLKYPFYLIIIYTNMPVKLQIETVRTVFYR